MKAQGGRDNAGYQRDDERIVDYGLWELPGANVLCRGPRPGSDSPYFVAIGAAQTFGRFVERPYPVLLSESIGMPCVNLGVSGAGPSFFFENKQLMDVINGAEFVIVQVMSGRSVGNSRFELGLNQGTVRERGVDNEKFIFAEDAYRKVLAEENRIAMAQLRGEVRLRWARETGELLRRIDPPKTLLWFSRRAPEYKEGFDGLGAYWGDFPHFINRDTIDAVKDLADNYVEVTSSRGLPQLLLDRNSGEAVELWGAEKFPNVVLRSHNHYYPSPEMHEDVFFALDAGKNNFLRKRENRSKPMATRSVLVHFHIYKNAGTSVDESLSNYFGNDWVSWDPVTTKEIFELDDLVRYLRLKPNLRCVSSHQLRMPLGSTPEIEIYPLIFLRHPIDRVASLYKYERLAGNPDSLYSRKARELGFGEFVNWALDSRVAGRPLSNYQTLILSRAQVLRGSSWDRDVTLQDLSEASAVIHQLPVVGIVDQFEESAIALERWLDPIFSGLMIKNVQRNVMREEDGKVLRGRLQKIELELGRATFSRLVQANEYDLELYRLAADRLRKD